MCYELSCAQGEERYSASLEDRTPPSYYRVYPRTPLSQSSSAAPVSTTAMAPAPLVPLQVLPSAARVPETAQAPSPVVPANAPGS
jgi:hypothetical protein